jgi:hypothetical protein
VERGAGTGGPGCRSSFLAQLGCAVDYAGDHLCTPRLGQRGQVNLSSGPPPRPLHRLPVFAGSLFDNHWHMGYLGLWLLHVPPGWGPSCSVEGKIVAAVPLTGIIAAGVAAGAFQESGRGECQVHPRQPANEVATSHWLPACPPASHRGLNSHWTDSRRRVGERARQRFGGTGTGHTRCVAQSQIGAVHEDRSS